MDCHHTTRSHEKVENRIVESHRIVSTKILLHVFTTEHDDTPVAGPSRSIPGRGTSGSSRGKPHTTGIWYYQGGSGGAGSKVQYAKGTMLLVTSYVYPQVEVPAGMRYQQLT